MLHVMYGESERIDIKDLVFHIPCTVIYVWLLTSLGAGRKCLTRVHALPFAKVDASLMET